MEVDDYQLSILIVDNQEISVLNKKYFDKNRPTDVIAFPMQDDESGNLNPHILGDVVISAERASEQALELGHSTEKEITILLIHGILHLFGFRDDTQDERKKMEGKTFDILSFISS